MSPSLVSLPPELLFQILSYLPIRSLLNFSLASRGTHGIATSSIHTLSLGVYPSRMSGVISRLSMPKPSPAPRSAISSFSGVAAPSPSLSAFESEEDLSASLLADPYAVNVIIPDGQALDYTTLLSFHSALTISILDRYQYSLRHLHLNLWTLSCPIAEALASLQNVRTLSLRIEDPVARLASRRRGARQRVEEGMAWSKLAGSWKKLQALQIESARLTEEDLVDIVAAAPLKELWVRRCVTIGKGFWERLSELPGRNRIEVLGILHSGEVDEEVLGWIAEMKGLKYLSLAGWRGVDAEIIEETNEEVWHIPEVILPKPAHPGLDVIEVDPAYT